MEITDVKVECYSAPLPTPISNGRYTYATSERCLVRVETSDGVTGLGLGDGGVGLAGAARMIEATIESLRPWLIGEDPLAIERLWARMWAPKLLGRRGFTTRVISTVDIALWDLRGQVFGAPVATLLGAAHESLPAYVAGGYYTQNGGVLELAREVARYVELGARALKMKIGAASLAADAARVRAVRDAVGADVKLMVDANNAYSVFEAIEMAHLLEPLDVYWFEEPVMPDDLRGLKRVAHATRLPIATGENEYTRYGFRDLIEHGDPAILNADAQFLGGVTEFMKVAALAQAHDLPVAPHGSHDIHVHLATAIPNGLIVEYSPPGSDPLLEPFQADPLPLIDGQVRPPARPGFGLIIDEKRLAHYRVL
jgi:L-alanine-DL-glutamate epimerase-like enolase superfamily enzyme